MTSSIVVCRQLSHGYSGKAALSNINLELTAGEPVGLVGPNGAGKSTFLNILAGFLLPTSGTVNLFGYPARSSALIGKVSALPQDAQLDPVFTIAEQLVFYARLQGLTKPNAISEVSRVLEAVSLQDAAQQKPGALSHGMAKRVAIAQALIGNPALTLLDEPTAGLDPTNVRAVRTLIADLSTEITFIISSHDLAELDRQCPRILLLEKGVLQTEKLALHEQQNAARFITLQMEYAPTEELMTRIQSIAGVIGISNPQKNEFIVEYDSKQQDNMDQHLLQCISSNHWQYRRISHGKSLEEKLFFSR